MEKDAEYEPAALIGRDGLGRIIRALAEGGHEVIGPVVRDGAIVYETIDGIADLPAGWTDRQAPGHYSIERRPDEALFGFTVGPHSWKQFLHPPTQTQWSATRGEDGGLSFTPAQAAPKPLAFIGVRACEMQAIMIQDRILRDGETADAGYARRRNDAFIVAINCSEAGETCFCASMDAGPRVQTGFDLALTELVSPGAHEFLVETGSAAGAALLAEIPRRPADTATLRQAEELSAQAAASMGRTLDTRGIKELLQHNPEHERWDDVAARCLSCGNCTMVCPTCFCTTTEDIGDLHNRNVRREKTWDSCFTLDFSYIHGGSVRSSTRSRYRQWLTHKLANWIDQFGTSGCVGCGRCIAWCPVGIDLTEEVRAIRGEEEMAR